MHACCGDLTYVLAGQRYKNTGSLEIAWAPCWSIVCLPALPGRYCEVEGRPHVAREVVRSGQEMFAGSKSYAMYPSRHSHRGGGTCR